MRYQWTNEVVILTAFPLHYALSNSPNLQLTMTRNFLHRVFPGPLFGQLLVLRLVRFIQSGNANSHEKSILKVLYEDTWQFLEQEGRQGWGRRAKSRWRATLLRWSVLETTETWGNVMSCQYNYIVSVCVTNLRMSRQIDPLELMLGW